MIMTEVPNPKIVVFACNWCSYAAMDLAGTSRMTYPPNMRVIRVMCSGRIDPQFILKAFKEGANGVLVAGCHPGDCHYMEGNYKALRRLTLLRRMLDQQGIEKERFRLEWISASEGDKFMKVANEMVEELKALKPQVDIEPIEEVKK
jgi:F420-non-reducing hydrogenase iron-sulfur subunit